MNHLLRSSTLLTLFNYPHFKLYNRISKSVNGEVLTVSKIIKATLDEQNQVHYQGQPLIQGNYHVLITILDEPEDEAVYSALNPGRLEQLNPERLKQIINSMATALLAEEATVLSPRQPGLLKGQLGDAFFEPLPEEELRAWES
jgi:hypothetical protein